MNYPKDLAKIVSSTIFEKVNNSAFDNILTTLFEVMFFSSLKTEELAAITYSIVYIDPNNSDPDPPKRIVADRWSHISFEKNIPFDIPNITKLAKATDPKSSSLAVYHDEQGELFIWGFIDQMNQRNDFINLESETGPEGPGFFQASVESLGHIVVYSGFYFIAELRQNKLIVDSLDVFSSGPIRNILQPSITSFINIIKESTDSECYRERGHWEISHSDLWLTTLCRLLIKIKSYNHGGALLITSSSDNDKLNIKYGVKYSRLKEALIRKATLQVTKTCASDIIHTQMDNKENFVDMKTYLDEAVFSTELRDTNKEINGCLLYMAHLSKVDGLILLDHDLTLRGFGVEVTAKNDPKNVYKSNVVSSKESSLEQVDFKHYGTRHRSMMRYCDLHEGSIGFVISQDGNVKAITKVNDKLIMWEDIDLFREIE